MNIYSGEQESSWSAARHWPNDGVCHHL